MGGWLLRGKDGAGAKLREGEERERWRWRPPGGGGGGGGGVWGAAPKFFFPKSLPEGGREGRR